LIMTVDQVIETARAVASSGLPIHLAKLDVPAGLEPMTAFTDAILAVWTAALAGVLFARSDGRRATRWWGLAFVATVVTSLAGVAYHGWRVFFTPIVPLTLVAWKVVPIATAIAAFCLDAAAAMLWLSPRRRNIVISFT